MAVPDPIGRLTAFLTDVWESGRAKISQEIDQLVSGINADRAAMNVLQTDQTTLSERFDALAYPSGIKSGLRVYSSYTQPDTDIIIKADALGMVDKATVVTDLDVTLDLGDPAGVGGLDTGTVAADTWYYVFAVADAARVLDDDCLASLASTPALPTGYDTYRLVGFVRTDTDSDIIFLTQIPSLGYFGLWPADYDYGEFALQGVYDNSAWQEVDLSSYLPPEVRAVRVKITGACTLQCAWYIRPTGSSSDYIGRDVLKFNFDDSMEGGLEYIMDLPLDDDQTFEIIRSGNAFTSSRLSIMGYFYDF